MANGLNALVGGGQQGYDWMDRVLQTRKERTTADQGAEAKRALAERIAQGPASLGGAIPTPTQAAAPVPTGDGMPAAAPEGQAAIPTGMGGGSPGGAEPTPAPVDPDVNQFELETKQRTGRDVPMGKDWDAFRQELMTSAAAIGDPNTVTMVDEYVDKLQNKGFAQNAARAQMAASIGDKQGTAYHLQKAFGFLNTGDAPRIQAVEDGNFVLMPVDENTNKPSGNPVVLDAKAIGNLVAMSKDPAKFAEWKATAEEDAKKTAADIKRGEATTAYNERIATVQEEQLKESKRKNKADEAIKRDTAKAKGIIANAKKTGNWNDASTRALTNDVARYINTRKQSASDDIYNLYDTMGNEIASDIINLARYSEDYDLPKFTDFAERAAQNGHTFELDEGTGDIIVVTPVGDIAIEDY